MSGHRVPVHHPTKAGTEVKLHTFFITALGGDGWSGSRCDRFTPQVKSIQAKQVCARGWVGPRTGRDVVATGTDRGRKRVLLSNKWGTVHTKQVTSIIFMRYLLVYSRFYRNTWQNNIKMDLAERG
jgi:hypothetical protein